jgi:hypothetical protein
MLLLWTPATGKWFQVQSKAAAAHLSGTAPGEYLALSFQNYLAMREAA